MDHPARCVRRHHPARPTGPIEIVRVRYPVHDDRRPGAGHADFTINFDNEDVNVPDDVDFGDVNNAVLKKPALPGLSGREVEVGALALGTSPSLLGRSVHDRRAHGAVGRTEDDGPAGLGPGATVLLRRVLFGLLDVSGWRWAADWLPAHRDHLHARLPAGPGDYFTVDGMIELGILVGRRSISAAGAEPGPPSLSGRALTPWHPSPTAPVNLSCRRRGWTAERSRWPRHPVRRRQRRGVAQRRCSWPRRPVGIRAREEGPVLPEPWTSPTALVEGGNVYVFGGSDADGNRPTPSSS